MKGYMRRNKLKKYYSIFMLGFENALEYRGNYAINLISVFFPIMMQYFVWTAVFTGKAEGERIFGLTYAEAIIYTLCAGFVAKLISTGCHHQISQDIKGGTLNQFLVQPIKYVVYQVFRSFGEKILEMLIVFTILLVFIFVVAPGMGMSVEFNGIGMFLIAFIPAMILNFLIFLSVSMLAFWIVEVGRLYSIIDILVAIVSGSIFPLSIFGDKVSHIFEFLPFTYTTYFLTNTLNGSVDIHSFVRGIFIQIAWIGLFFIICKMTWFAGLKKYAAVGG
ncbi:ABC transporter permease [Acetivibrio ethanolgignens]|nr:ABC-2 family transporter protein [Acetivibrio ethanolgignens]